jgi:hypothetical protein
MVIPPMMSVGHFMSTTIGESNMDQKSSTTQRYVATLSDDEFVQNSFGKLGLTKPLVSALVAQSEWIRTTEIKTCSFILNISIYP